MTVSWGAVGASLAVTLGGGAVVSCLAFVAACGIDLVGRATRSRVPPFYQQTAGGLLATLVAVGAAVTRVDADPSLIVTAGIIILLAGIGLMGAMADALDGVSAHGERSAARRAAGDHGRDRRGGRRADGR